MAETDRPMFSSVNMANWRTWLPQAGVMVYLLISIFANIAVLVSAFQTVESLRFNSYFLPYLAGLFYLGAGIWIFSVHRQHIVGRIFTAFCASVALVFGGIFVLKLTQDLPWAWLAGAGIVFGGASFVDFAFQFPQEGDWITRNSPWRLVPYGIATILAVLIFAGQVGLIFDLDVAFAAAAIVFGLAWLIFRRAKSPSPVEREQINVVLFSSLVSFGPVILSFISSLIFPETNRFFSFILLTLAIFPILVGYVIQRHRLTHSNFILSQTLLFGFMALLVSLVYALLASGLGLIFSQGVGPVSPLFTGLIFFALAMCLIPLRNQLEKTINNLFLRGEQAYQERLQTFSSDLTSLVDLSSIIKALRQVIETSLVPGKLHIYIFDPLEDQYKITKDLEGRTTSDLNFPAGGALAQYLNKRKTPLSLGKFENLPAELNSEKVRIRLLGGNLVVPLPGRERLAGWLVLGSRLSGDEYVSRDFGFLETLCDQASLAIERAQVVDNLESRVRQMNALARVAQGINITLTMDDILELVYAQTTQIIPADDFKIFLADSQSGKSIPIFIVVDNERLTSFENKMLPQGKALEQEVIHQHRSMLTDDYPGECQRRGISSDLPGVYGWMGVPLSAGAGTIGSMSVGNHDISVSYNREQLNLLQSIADQAAGAIVKARLLQESQRHAHQLSTLNEVTRQLTSTLNQEPLLLNILESAVEILNCEAGSLLMVDNQTDELVFKVTVGPVAQDLTNLRLPPGTGEAGKAVKTRLPVVVNDVAASPEWFSKTDKETGFHTHAILVIPLEVKDIVIGVIEVLNKKDGLPFSQEETELLSAFASQAAVAIENARLYTSTDQALAARVEELSVMQRIDRELNTSLDTKHAMQITLDWAMRQSNANAGLVGTLEEEDGLLIMAWRGYTDEMELYQNIPLAVKDFYLDTVIESGLPQRIVLPDENYRGLLKEGRSLVIIPIRRESNTIGLILLESILPELPTEDIMVFLTRLSDHASIAISNAQLYNAVQSANIAKSEFVSFVSHELKNPMTSIKGYTELLAAGAVGPVNEAQANFLVTIRSNVERMSTLVSDLNDVSRIEAGRLRLDFKAVVLSEIAEEVVRSLRRQIEEKSQKLTIQLPPELSKVWADRSRVVQIVTNLISNATKYTQASGEILVQAETCDNQWDANGAARVVHVWVNDNGIGIGPDDQKKIFQKFFRSEDPKTREATGTGLGLNITRSLVEMQGGRIWFESEFRKGTTFHFTLPIAE
jgi:signal transduction histidine kinase/putative methionine-R-sulfoxide reductase with GAF domain